MPAIKTVINIYDIHSFVIMGLIIWAFHLLRECISDPWISDKIWSANANRHATRQLNERKVFTFSATAKRV